MFKQLPYAHETNLSCFYTNNQSNSNLNDEWEIEFCRDEGPERNDHQFRITGKYSTAHYKYLQIISKECSNFDNGCINLAEGAGGVSALCYRKFGYQNIIYNSLISVSDACSHRATSFIPGELEMIKNNI